MIDICLPVPTFMSYSGICCLCASNFGIFIPCLVTFYGYVHQQVGVSPAIIYEKAFRNAQSILHQSSRNAWTGTSGNQSRRLHADLTMCYKIVHNLVDIPFDEFFKYSEHNSRPYTWSPTKVISIQPVARINARAHFSLFI